MTTTAIPAITPEMIREHGLTPDEFEKIKQLLGGREPTRTELGIFIFSSFYDAYSYGWYCLSNVAGRDDH